GPSARRTVRRLDQYGRMLRSHRVAGIHDRLDRALGHFSNEVALPVVLQAEGDLREEALDLEITDGPDPVEQRLCNLLEWADQRGAARGRPVVAGGDHRHLAHLRRDHDGVAAAELGRSRHGYIAEDLERLASVLDRPDDHATQQLPDR